MFIKYFRLNLVFYFVSTFRGTVRMNNLVIKKSKINNKGVFANHNFKKGEEITSSYLEPGEKCNCGSTNCKGIIC